MGDKIDCKIIKVNTFGLFVELEKNIQGLAHVSQLSDKSNVNPLDIAKAGETREFYVVSLDPKNHRLGLSLVKPKTQKTDEPNDQPVEISTEDKLKEEKADNAKIAEETPKKRGRKPKTKPVEPETPKE